SNGPVCPGRKLARLQDHHHWFDGDNGHGGVAPILVIGFHDSRGVPGSLQIRPGLVGEFSRVILLAGVVEQEDLPLVLAPGDLADDSLADLDALIRRTPRPSGSGEFGYSERTSASTPRHR